MPARLHANDGELHEEFEKLVAQNVLALFSSTSMQETVFAIQAAKGSHEGLVISRSRFKSFLEENFDIRIQRIEFQIRID